MQRRLLVVLGVVTSMSLSCLQSSSEKSSPQSLDEALRPGQTRAGLITKDSELLHGTTAKGRAGDYKIYNSKIAVVIGQPGVSRGYHPYGGTILDADRVRPAGAEQHSTFGEMIAALDLAVLNPKTIEVVSDGSKGGEARIRVVGEEGPMPFFDALFSELFMPVQHDMEWSVDYVLEPDAEWLKIEYSMFNRGKEAIEYGLPVAAFMFGDGAKPFLPGFGFRAPSSGSFGPYYGAIAEDVSYLYGRIDAPLNVVVSESGIIVTGIGDAFRIRGRETAKVTHHLVIGDGDLSRTQQLWDRAAKRPSAPMITGRVLDSNNKPLRQARVHVTDATATDAARDYVSMARTDDNGRYSIALQPGSYTAIAAADGYTVSTRKTFEVATGKSMALDFSIAPPGSIRYLVTDGDAAKLPVKLSVEALSRGTDQLPARYGEVGPAYGLLATVFAIYGEGTFSVPAGDYKIYISRGPEYEVAERTVSVTAGGEASFEATLVRTVDTTGWLSTDTHIHSQLSPDSPDLFPFKVATMVTENLEIPVSTEHESIGDFNPAIRDLGLEKWIQGVVGSEITTMVYGHFNAFPLVPDPTKPGSGRVEWYKKKPGETFAAIRANPGNPFLQVNHPRSTAIGGYFSAMGFHADTFTFDRPNEASLDFDSLEVANGCDLGEIELVTKDWFSFLNHGRRVYATGSTDNHNASGGDMGFPRTYVRMPTDDPHAASMDDVRTSMKAGRLIVSCGPFVEMKIGQAEIGDTAMIRGNTISIDAHVRAPSWMDVDTIEVFVNGALVQTVPVPESTDAVRFSGPIEVPYVGGHDGWVVLRARGDRAHGVWARNRPSFAFTNAIFLDGNEDGDWVME